MIGARAILSLLVILSSALPVQSRAKGPELPSTTIILSSMTRPDSVMAMIDRLPADAVEGVWKFGGDGATILIVKRPRSLKIAVDYVVVSLGGADRSLHPGTVIGTINRGGERGAYRASFYKQHTGPEGLTGKSEFTLHLDADNAFLRFEPRHSQWRFYLPALLPGIAGRMVHQGYMDRSCDGCHRLYHEPLTPV